MQRHDKTSILVISVVGIIALGGLLWVYSQDSQITGLVIGTGNIPLALSGEITNCNKEYGLLTFTREDGAQYNGLELSGNYLARVKNFEDVPTQFDVSFKNGQFIQTIVIPIPSSRHMNVDLSCTTPTPTPTQEPTIVPTDEPTQEPTIVPTDEPTQEPTIVPTLSVTATPTISATSTP
jgi:hypothetical protein